MRAIRARNTKPELIVRRGLHARGLRFRLYRRNLPGTPDLVFPGRRALVFVNGCFWHAHEGCPYYTLPQTNREKWKKKLEGNRERDARDQAALRAAGWRVIVVWECEFRGKDCDQTERTLNELAENIIARPAAHANLTPPGQ